MEQLYDDAIAYANTIINSSEFKRMKELRGCIKTTLSGKIMAFKTAEAKFFEAKEYGTFHPDLKKYQQLYVEKKKNLYEDPMIIEYKKLERTIQKKLDDDLNDLKKSISNKFHLTKSLTILE